MSRSRLWYAYILFAVVFVALAGCLSFALGRIIDITTLATFDYKTYDEVPIWGDVADDPNVNITFDQWNVRIVSKLQEIPNPDINLLVHIPAAR